MVSTKPTSGRNRKTVWIGLVQVMPRTTLDVMNGAVGAYTNALALAISQPEYEIVVREGLTSLDLIVIGFENIEPFATRAARVHLSTEMRGLARRVRQTQQVQFGSFYTFRESGDETVN